MNNKITAFDGTTYDIKDFSMIYSDEYNYMIKGYKPTRGNCGIEVILIASSSRNEMRKAYNKLKQSIDFSQVKTLCEK